MKSYKRLNILGTKLNEEQAGKYIEKIAYQYNLKNTSDRKTYPIINLEENFKFICETYELLNMHIKNGIKIHSAGEWILDNFYIIEENVKILEKELSLKKYRKLPGISDGEFKGFARIYILAAEIINISDFNIEEENVKKLLITYQNKRALNIDEIVSLPLFLKIILIDKIRNICEQIYSSQIQKNKVENIIKRLIEKKENENKIIYKRKIQIKEKSKYSFIEYMSYRLKKYGKETIEYQKILEQEVEKIGMSISEVIQKEHFYIANSKIMIGNCIKSIKAINRIDIGNILEEVSITETVLNKDPAQIYMKMDQETKNEYRKEIQKFAVKAKVSELYVAEQILKLAEKYKDEKRKILKRKSHIGYYLIDDGRNQLEEILFNRKIKKLSLNQKARLYISCFAIISIILDFFISKAINLIANKNLAIVGFILLIIPISEIVVKIQNYILNKFSSKRIIPKMNYEMRIPDASKTFIVIPSIIKSKEKVIELFNKLEVYYLANKQENLYFALLGDCSQSQKEVEEFDEEVIKEGIYRAHLLNEKYKINDFNKFHFLYRKRTWNDSEFSYIGWERKRGLLANFNLYIKKKIDNNFRINTIEDEIGSLPEFKYIITLDSDTNLVLDSAAKMIGAMDHILNEPIVENKKVISGYGIMQPRIVVDIKNHLSTNFTKLYSGVGGIDFYSGTISDIYQDFFKEGIFTGKGIFNIDVYNEILENQIPENTVLSHDLLEGIYLKCALISDTILLDSYPKKYIPYILRNHRWVRGDWQIIKWLDNKNVNEISKFKIFDNLRRSLVSIFCLIDLILGVIFFEINKKFSNIFIIVSVIAVLISYIIDIFDYIILKKSRNEDYIIANKKFSNELNRISLDIVRMLLIIAVLPFEAIKNLDAILKSIYRMIKKVKLLEWITAEEAENSNETSIKSYYTQMCCNVFLGIIGIISKNLFFKILGIIWIIAPYIMYRLSLNRKKEFIISEENEKLLKDIGNKTWDFFEKYLVKENNYLIVDNYQEDRKNKVVYRTSSTNIGLEIMSIISACDLNYISLEKAKEYIEKILETINILPKWNGHLYNWYNIKTLEPLIPRFISTVDSGNFVGYLIVLKQFIIEKKLEENLLNNVQKLINNADFSVLYNEKIKLFSVGFNIEENSLVDSYYDFLASEARLASLVAIAKKDIESKHWNNLSRTLTTLNGYKGLVSWTGTTFEYLMPNIVMEKYEGTLLDEASKFCVYNQIRYANKFNIPWGISESAYNLKDLNYNYQYKAFGIPNLGLKRGLEEDLVVSPYSTFLSLREDGNCSIENIKKLIKQNLFGKYGFYEAIDYTPKRNSKISKNSIVKTYMAHHQGLILNSINNYLNENILIKRFNINPEIEAVDVLLQEKMPKDIIIKNQRKNKIEKKKLVLFENYFERNIEYSKTNRKINVLANDNYKLVINNLGESSSYYKNNLIYSYKPTLEYWQGINIYIKNLKNKKIYNPYLDSNIIYRPDSINFSKKEEFIKTNLNITIDPNSNTEIRQLELWNLGNQEELFEIITDFVPVLSIPNQEYLHPAFNKMFLKVEEENNNLIVERRNRNLENKIYLVSTLYTENEQIGDFEYEIDREKYLGRENYKIPEAILKNYNFSNDISYKTDYIVAMKRILKIKPNQKVKINLILITSEEKEKAIKIINNLKNLTEINKIFDLSKARAEEELRYLQINRKNAIEYSELLDYLLDNNFSNDKKIDFEKSFKIQNLWRFGISGDIPIILIYVKDITDMYVLEEIINAYIYFRNKKIYIDLIIINEQKYLMNNIEEQVLNAQVVHLKNISTGIFIFDKEMLNIEVIETIEYKAKIIAKNVDSLKNLLKELNDNKEIYETRKNKFINQLEENVENNFEAYYSEDGKKYIMKITKFSKTPMPWSNILTNKFFGVLTTENMGGFCWSKNSRLNRISAWNNDSILNLPSEIIYFKDYNQNECWTLNNWINSDSKINTIEYGFGYSKYYSCNKQINEETTIFVSKNEKQKIIKVKLINNSDQKRYLKILYYLKDVLGEDEIFTKGNINIKKEDNIIFIKNLIEQEGFENRIIYVTSNLKIKSFTGEKENFFGTGNLEYPDALDYERLNNKVGIGKDNCLGIHFEIDLNSYEEKEFYILLGEERNTEKVKEILQEFNQEKIQIEFEQITKYWNGILENIKIEIPDKELETLINGWILYQIISSRIFAKSSFYQSGGAYGFRDQLQDVLSLKYLDPDILKNQILLSARHQFIEGDVLHWWHEETKRGIRTKFSDDLLWLVYATIEYIEFTGDYKILDEQIEYLKGEQIQEDEKYDIYYNSEIKENLYNHCMKAIKKSLNFGKDGIPKIGSGDWNDGFNKVGNKGEGQSVWLGFFIYDILNRFNKITKRYFKNSNEELEKIKNKLKENLNLTGWDGRWYKRAIDDNGNLIGSIESEECTIDSIVQSWSVISEAADNDKKYMAIEAVDNYLVDKEKKLIKLFSPAFEKTRINPGYIKAYTPGMRENGGQYTHAAIWYVLALLKLGFHDKAMQYLKMISPIEHTKNLEEIKKYKIEPYVIPADIYSTKGLEGRGGWSWYTGSASWFYKVVIEEILGFKIKENKIVIEPKVPSNWKEYKIQYKYKTAVYNIKVKKEKNLKNTKLLVNGIEIKENKIDLLDDGKIYNIEFIF